MRCGDVVAAPSWELPTPQERRRWRRWDRRVVRDHEAAMLGELLRLADQHASVEIVEVRAGSAGVALLDVAGQRLILGGVAPSGLAGLAGEAGLAGLATGTPWSRPGGHLLGAGRYGELWWVNLGIGPASRTVAARQVRLARNRHWDAGPSTPPPDPSLRAPGPAPVSASRLRA